MERRCIDHSVAGGPAYRFAGGEKLLELSIHKVRRLATASHLRQQRQRSRGRDNFRDAADQPQRISSWSKRTQRAGEMRDYGGRRAGRV